MEKTVPELPENLVQEILSGEGVSVEFKEAARSLPDNLFETVCAMLNRNGGHVFLGVSDMGEILGVDTDKISQIKKDFVNLCNNPQKIFPTVHLDMREFNYKNKVILYVYVFEGSDVYNTNGKVFDRNEDGDFDITRSTSSVAQLYIRKNSTYTENKVFPGATMEDLRPELIDRARKLALARRPDHPWGAMNDEELLRSAELYEKDLFSGREGLNLAGILLFGKDETIKSALPHYRTDAIYRINDEDRYDDRDDVRTNLIDSVDRLVAFVMKHTDDKFYLDGSQRVSLMGIIARELCVNMIAHREYSNPLPARLIINGKEIISENANKPRAIGPMSLDGYNPYPKNPKIANFFKEIGYAEELGSGIRKISKYTVEYSGEEPHFRDDNCFQAIIPLISQGQENAKLQDDVCAFIAKKGGVSRKAINAEFYPRMKGMSPEQKESEIHNVLTRLRRRLKIKNVGSRSEPIWQLV